MYFEDTLDKRIEAGLKELDELDVGSDEYVKATEAVSKLIAQRSAIEKNNLEAIDRADRLDEEKKDHILKNVLTGISVIGGLIYAGWSTICTFKFEETGIIGSGMSRNIVNGITRFIKK